MKPEFDPESHTYRVSGRRYPSVTEILGELGMVKDLSFLDPFYRQRGSSVHACMKIHLDGEEIEWGFEGAEHVRPRFERLARLADAAGMKPILSEQPLASAIFGYAGTADYFGPFDDHPFAIVDYKGDSFEKGHHLQVAGGYRGLIYEAACERVFGDVDPAEVLHCPCFLVPAGGTAERATPFLIPDEDGIATELFRAAAAVYNWRLANLGDPRATASI